MNRRLSSILLSLALIVGLHVTFAALSSDLSERFPDKALPPPQTTTYTIQEESSESELESMPVRYASIQDRETVDIEALRERLHRSSHGFSVPASLHEPVNFWRKIYGVYHTNHSVIHDSEDLSKIYQVLDFGYIQGLGISKREKVNIRARREKHEVKKIQESLDKETADRVRVQVGLRNHFKRAVKLSGEYLPLFENIFESYGLPKELTRLVFVESLFVQKARSKVGAAGLWQFMPATAKHFLKVDRLIDERYDPIFSTHAAAKLLKQNYRSLQSWPLAITAYNAGVRRMKKAVRKVGTKDIGEIIHNYRLGSFGFASRNFYPSFLAALQVSSQAEDYFGPLTQKETLLFDVLVLPEESTFSQLAFWSSTSLDNLESLNPSFSQKVIEGKYLLPTGSQIRIPVGRTSTFSTRLAQYPAIPRDVPVDFSK